MSRLSSSTWDARHCQRYESPAEIEIITITQSENNTSFVIAGVGKNDKPKSEDWQIAFQSKAN